MSGILFTILLLVALPAAISSLYLLVCTLLSEALPRPARSTRRLRFDIVIPAHNEAGNIKHTIDSVLAVSWPREQYRVLVVADNCTDDTAAVARDAGATVLERQDASKRGKGYALEFAFQHCLESRSSNAIVVIDADAQVSTNLLEAFSARIEAGEDAVQAHYGVSNPMDSWRTRLITIAKAAFHIVRSRARERLRLSCGIRGNGWCVTHAVLQRVPYGAFSLTEDLEYGIRLGLAGVRVAYADEAHSDAEMVSNAAVASKQRQRWEAGRFQLVRSMTAPLLAAAFRKPSAICLDLALDLLVLPLSYIVINIVALAVLSALCLLLGLPVSTAFWIAVGCAAVLLLYVLRGWQLSQIGWIGLLDLFRAPGFVVWKLILNLRKRSDEWVRTERGPQEP